jgi:hypothetical protein
MRAQKMREEAVEKERDEYFNIIRPVILMKQEWRVKEKVDTPAPTTSGDDMDLLDDDEASLIKDVFPPPTDMDINMLFMMSAKFRGIEEEVTQMCLSPKEAVFDKPALETIVHLGTHRREASLQDARRWQCCRQSNVVHHLQEAWKEERRARED